MCKVNTIFAKISPSNKKNTIQNFLRHYVSPIVEIKTIHFPDQSR